MVGRSSEPVADAARAARTDQIRREPDRKKRADRIVNPMILGLIIVMATIVGLSLIPIYPPPHRQPNSSEAQAALGTIKDRLRVKFVQNKNKVDLSWRLSDLVNTTELNGKYYGADDYSLLDLTESTAVFRVAANTNTASPQVTMTVTNIETGAATLTSP